MQKLVRLKLFQYPGGDFYIAKELLRRINSLCTDKCTFMEIFGGSGYISQNVDRAKYLNVIYNDIDSRLTAFYEAIKENPEQLKEILSTIPYSRELYYIMMNIFKENGCLGKLENAVLMFYTFNVSFWGNKTGFAYSKLPRYNESKKYWKRIDKITEVAKAWRNIIIENLDFREVIKRYDYLTTVFYADPPFVNRGKHYYGREFSENDLQELAKLLSQIKGKFLLKLDGKTYEVIKDILPENMYKVERLERSLMMEKVVGEHRNKWTLVLVSNK